MATRQKARAAAAEKNGKPNSTVVKWRGLELVAETGNLGWLMLEDSMDLASYDGARKLLRAVLGDEQWETVKAKVRADGLGLDEAERVVFNDKQSLFSKVASVVGLEVGESSASDSS